MQVTVALSTLLGVDDQPGELDGYGPIPAVLARAIASDENGTWRRLVTDDHGQLLDYGRTKYSPPANLRRHVTARDHTCRFPHCNRTARSCEQDHVIPWAQGGTTSPDNLIPLCPRHHHTKHDAGWKTRRLPDGSIEWTSTTGHHYTVKPNTYPIDTTPDDPDPPALAV